MCDVEVPLIKIYSKYAILKILRDVVHKLLSTMPIHTCSILQGIFSVQHIELNTFKKPNFNVVHRPTN